MAVQTEIIKTKIAVMKPTNSRTPIEVGDTMTVILNTDDEAYASTTVVLTYADEVNHEYGWDRSVTDLRSLDVKRPSNIHTPACS